MICDCRLSCLVMGALFGFLLGFRLGDNEMCKRALESDKKDG